MSENKTKVDLVFGVLGVVGGALLMSCGAIFFGAICLACGVLLIVFTVIGTDDNV